MSQGSIPERLWKAKFTIALAFLLLAAIAVALLMFNANRGLENELWYAHSDLNTLNDTHNKLVSDHALLISDKDSLNKKYIELDKKYNNLSVDKMYLQSSFDSLNSTYISLNDTVANFREPGGAVIALAYSSYVTQTTDPKKVVDATAYNVGSARANKVYIKCRIQENNTTSIKEQVFTNMNPLTKGHVTWEFDDLTLVQSIWTELGS